jgi:hypothetical protein
MARPGNSRKCDHVPEADFGNITEKAGAEVKKQFLATDPDGTLHVFIGITPPVLDSAYPGFYEGIMPENCEYCGQVYPENIDGPIPAPGTFVKCRLTITKAGAE